MKGLLSQPTIAESEEQVATYFSENPSLIDVIQSVGHPPLLDCVNQIRAQLIERMQTEFSSTYAWFLRDLLYGADPEIKGALLNFARTQWNARIRDPWYSFSSFFEDPILAQELDGRFRAAVIPKQDSRPGPIIISDDLYAFFLSKLQEHDISPEDFMEMLKRRIAHSCVDYLCNKYADNARAVVQNVLSQIVSYPIHSDRDDGSGEVGAVARSRFAAAVRNGQYIHAINLDASSLTFIPRPHERVAELRDGSSIIVPIQ